MNKRLLASAFVLAGALALSAPSGAQVATYNLNLTNISGKGFSVTIEKWDGTVNGPGSIFRVQKVQALGFPNGPANNGVEVNVSFWGNLGCAGGNVGIASITGISGTSTTISATDPDPATDSWIQTAYNGVGEKEARFLSDNTGNVANTIRASATNKFVQSNGGRINTAGLIAAAKITVIDTFGHEFEGCVDMSTSNVPEASSLALLLPGLVPLGLVMRRRARSRT